MICVFHVWRNSRLFSSVNYLGKLHISAFWKFMDHVIQCSPDLFSRSEIKIIIITLEILFSLLFSFLNIPYQSTLIIDCKGYTECFTLALIFLEDLWNLK